MNKLNIFLRYVSLRCFIDVNFGKFECYIRLNIDLEFMPRFMPLNQFENVFFIDFGCNLCNMVGNPLYLWTFLRFLL